MGNEIFFFSGTGNSLWVAKELAKALPAPTNLKGIVAYNEGDTLIKDTERLGFVFPVYSWGPPRIVANFLKRLKIEGNPFIFSVVTCGGSHGATLAHLNNFLQGQGKHLDAGYALRFPGNYTPLYGAPKDEQCKKLLEEAKKKLEAILPEILEKRSGVVESDFFFLRPLSYIMYPFFRFGLQFCSNQFWVTEACTHCGLCVKICPVGNIRQEVGKHPEWGKMCEQCMACLQHCPTEAIQFSVLTKGRRRYKHPEISVNEIISQKDR